MTQSFSLSWYTCIYSTNKYIQTWYTTEKEISMVGWGIRDHYIPCCMCSVVVQCKNVWVIIISKRGGVLTALHVPLEAAVCHTVTVVLHHPTMSKKSQRGRPTFSTPTHQKAAYSGNSHPTDRSNRPNMKLPQGARSYMELNHSLINSTVF